MDRRSFLLHLACGAAAAGGPLAAQQKALAADDFRILPLRMHLLRAKDMEELDCRLKPADAERILGKINRVWRQAGLQFYMESIREEEAASQQLYAGLADGAREGGLRLIRPRDSQSDRCFHLYFVRRMRPNGICLARSFELLFVKDTARLREVQGGIDEEIPRVCSHEIGHALGLEHRQDTFNLMASGTTGTSLNDEEIQTSRDHAGRMTFVLRPEEAVRNADRFEGAGDTMTAQALYRTLAGLPGGEIARHARQKLGS